MPRYVIFILGFFACIGEIFAASVAGSTISTGVSTTSSLFGGRSNWGMIDVLTAIETFLLRVALPLVIIGSALYIAYELFLAEGNEEKNKRAWKSLSYSIIGVLCIALAYAAVAMVSRLSI